MTPSPPAGDPHGSRPAGTPHWPPLDPDGPQPAAHVDVDTRPDTAAAADAGPAARTPDADLRRRLLGPAALRLGVTRRDRVLGWLGPLLVTALAAVLRLVHLDRPPTLVFDETYYVKQAYTLLRVGYEAQWPEDPNPAFEAGDVDTYLPVADYAVHPQVGKWLIALGMRLAGTEPVGWRLASAVAGTLTVLLLARIARRLFASTALGTLAGGLLAIDGQAIVHSRTGLLDGFLTLFVVAAFGALLLDRDQARRRLAHRCAPVGAAAPGVRGLGPPLGARPWRIVAGVLLGLAIGTKWSGLYFLAVFGLLTVAWDLAARRAAGVRRWLAGGVLRDGAPAFVAMVPVAAVTYLASWASWFRTPGAYGRDWAATHPGEGVSWLPADLRSWWHYHQDMWTFHRGLTAEHSYAANPWGWPVQWRPTSFFYEAPVPARAACGADRCSAAVTAIGNPVLWWAASLAVLAAVWWLVRHRDWRAGAALSGVVAGWVPWLGYAHRTVFTFYSIAFAPWMVLTLTWAVGRLLRVPDDGPAPRTGVVPRSRVPGLTLAVALVTVVVLVSAFFLPMWTAQTVPFWFWQLHIWLPTWV
ncbi:dolichyl-phosphate-mannose--protein mannosyltransferase [uncultured Cellulomonas sp.]|uniref:dolichyl-phosphate-mannose--protein mannosyltransferase n=1 Tax=uncultured Cellulomonas sp. TaxID=189682 RepID=UPI00261A470B|nr:phospholipid carrier-dependent glycosyltransferase [uncultured Cellulomonas sp.]